MSAVIAIGHEHDLAGFALAGVRVNRAFTRADILDAWNARDTDTGLAILSERAAEVLASELAAAPRVLTVVLP